LIKSEGNQIQVEHVPDRKRFEVRLQDEIAFLSYTAHDGDVSFDHTYVPDTWRGRGVAAQLVRAAADEARRRHWKILPLCSYVVTFFERHPEFADVLKSHRS
jgi:predicted GNAT family acetyltransferase